MPAITKKKQEKTTQILVESPEEIMRRRRAISAMAENRAGEQAYADAPANDGAAGPTGLAAEKAVGALCFLPKSLHRLATRAAEDRDLTAKRFFLETLLLGLEQQGVITPEQRADALTLPPEYGWKGRKMSDSSNSVSSQ